jgi:hypothetical protein
MQEPHSCTSWLIPSAKNSLGCCLNHCTTASYTQSFDVHVRALFNDSKVKNLTAVSSGCIQGVSMAFDWSWISMTGPYTLASLIQSTCSHFIHDPF